MVDICLLAAAANVGFEASVVAMNSYLSGLTRDEPAVVKAREELEEAVKEWERERATSSGAAVDDNQPEEANTDEQPLSSPNQKSSANRSSLNNPKILSLHSNYNTLLLQTTSRISPFGIALGHGSGLLLFILALVPVILMDGSTASLRLVIGLSEIWWGCSLFQWGGGYLLRMSKAMADRAVLMQVRKAETILALRVPKRTGRMERQCKRLRVRGRD